MGTSCGQSATLCGRLWSSALCHSLGRVSCHTLWRAVRLYMCQVVNINTHHKSEPKAQFKMKDPLGWSQCQTLPNKFRNSTFFPKKESYLTPKTSVYTLPPRPSVSRSFSFSESYSPETCQNNKSKSKTESNLTRTHSLYGLQDSKSKERQTHHRCSVSPQKERYQPVQPLSRSLSLASLQQAPVQNYLGQIQSAVSSTNHAGIWARGRKTSSCRNLKDLNDHDSLPIGSTAPGTWLTKVDPPIVPMRSKKRRKPPSSRSSLTRLSEDSSISSDSGMWPDTPPMHGCNNR